MSENKGFYEFVAKKLQVNIDSAEVTKALQDEEKKQSLREEYQQYKDAAIDATRTIVYDLLLRGKRPEATEELVKQVKKRLILKSTRNDKQPETYVYEEGIYVPNGETRIKELCRQILREQYTTQLVNQVISKLHADSYVNPQDFFNLPQQYPELTPVSNGLLNLETRELQPFDPEKVFFNKLPVNYQEEVKPEKTLGLLRDVLGRPEDIKVLQEVFGTSLYRTHKHIVSLMLLGNGENGKSTVIELVKLFFGAMNCSSIPVQDIDKPFMVVNLLNKHLNISGDISKDAIDNTGTFKSVTGGDQITANRKHQEMIQFVSFANFIFSANDLPPTKDLSDGFFRRWIILNFPYKFKDKEQYDETNPIHKLKRPNIIDEVTSDEEMSGLLNWALQGLERVNKNRGYSQSKTTDEIRIMWQRTSDSVAAFCMDYVEEDWDEFVPHGVFKKQYVKYCRIHKVTIQSDPSIKTVLSIMFGASDDRQYIEGTQVRGYSGIKLRPEVFDLKRIYKQDQKDSTSHYREKSKFLPIDENPVISVLHPSEDESKLTNIELKKDWSGTVILASGSKKVSWIEGEQVLLPSGTARLLIRKGIAKECDV